MKEIEQFYSLNFDQNKRSKRKIKYLVFHYTGMKTEKSAIKRLTNFNSKVSCHYFIKNNGEILTLVPDLYISWHAGISAWKKYRSINRNSIGIEISNPGHESTYKKFSKKQIKSVLKLSTFLVKKYNIKSNFILGHSDISPDRKKDPGEKFPWKLLSKYRIGVWHSVEKKFLNKCRFKKINKIEEKIFLKCLVKIGYFFKKNKINSISLYVKAFQRRFRPELINGKIDLECLEIAKSLVKYGFN